MRLTSITLALLIIFAINSINCAFAENVQPKEASAEINKPLSSAMAYSNRASMKFLKHDIRGALQDFDKAIEISPNNPELFLNRGYLKQLVNDKAGAMSDYDKAISLNSNFAYAYNNRGVLKVSLNDVKGALADYAKALEINDKYSDVYYNRANLRYMLDDNKGALDDYNIAIELNPQDAEAFNNRGVVKKRMNFNVGALSDYTQAIALNPKDSIAYANRGRLKKLYFDNEGAAIDLDQAVALAETQVFIKNVKPLLSNERYIAAIPTIKGNTENLYGNMNTQLATAAKPSLEQAQKSAVTVKSATPVLKTEEKTANAQQQLAYQTQSKKENAIAVKPVKEEKQTVQPSSLAAVSSPSSASTSPVAAAEKTPAGTIVASVATVQLPPAPIITTTAVKKNPTTNVKLAESYYIRGLQKCVLRDLQGAIADLNKAIENNSKYADAYYYRAAIRKELGDNEGFKKDYSTAIQMNPSLQAFNDSNCLTLISG